MTLLGAAKLHQIAFPQAEGSQVQELTVGMHHYDQAANPHYVDMYEDEDRDLLSAEDEVREARRMASAPSNAAQGAAVSDAQEVRSAFEKARLESMEYRKSHKAANPKDDTLAIPNFEYNTNDGEWILLSVYGRQLMENANDLVYLVIIEYDGHPELYWLRWGEGDYEKKRGLFLLPVEGHWKQMQTSAGLDTLTTAPLPEIKSFKRVQGSFLGLTPNMKGVFPPEADRFEGGAGFLIWPSEKDAHEEDGDVPGRPQKGPDSDDTDEDAPLLQPGAVA